MSPWRYLWLAVIYVVIAALPLVTTIGASLEYEYALMVAYLTIALIPLASFVPPLRWRFDPAGSGRAIKREWMWILIAAPALTMTPGLIALLTSYCQCSPTGFVFWLLIQWYPAFILAHAAAHLIARALDQGRSRGKIFLVFATLVASLVLLLVAELWFFPQKRITHLLAGFLHGPIYDTWIGLDEGILLARFSHLLLALLLLTLVDIRRRAVAIALAAVLLAGTATTSYLASTYPSTGIGLSDLDRLLPGEIVADGFTLRYVPDEAAATPPVEVDRLRLDAEFHVSELRELLGPNLPHVRIYAYPNETSKKLWFGGGSTDVADVYTPSIHITLGSWPHATLRHELVHALTSDVAFHGLGFHPNMAFTEGLAMALAPTERSMSLDDGAAALIKSGRLTSPQHLFSPLFWRESGSRAYTVAGSVINYLIATEGMAKVKQLYAGKPWLEVLSADEATLLGQWRKHVLGQFDEKAHALSAEALYRYPGLWQDRCPHSKEDLARSRDGDAFVRVRQPIDWDPSRDYWPWRRRLDPGDQRARLSAWRNEIDDLARARSPDRDQIAQWIKTLEDALTLPPKTLEDAELALLLSDVHRLQGETTKSLELLDRLAEPETAGRLGDDLLRQVLSRRVIARGLPLDRATPWRLYLAGWRRALPAAPARASRDAVWLMTYLRIRRGDQTLMSRGALRDAAGLIVPEQLPPTFHVEWHRFLGLRAMQVGAYQLAQTSYERAANLAPKASRSALAEHARRAAFYARHAPKARHAQAPAQRADGHLDSE